MSKATPAMLLLFTIPLRVRLNPPSRMVELEGTAKEMVKKQNQNGFGSYIKAMYIPAVAEVLRRVSPFTAAIFFPH